MVFANGRIPVADLVQAANGAPGQELEPQTAAQWAAMVAAAARDGVTLQPQSDSGIPSCYRSYDAQVYARDLYERGLGNVAAIPGTSNHGFGTAVDILIVGPVWDWLTAHAVEYGFDNNQGRADGEDWHWVRTRTVDVANITNTITSAKYRADEETEMYYKATSKSDDGAIGDGWTYKQIGNGPVVAVTNLESVAVQASGVFVAEYNGNDIRLLSAIHGLAEYEVLPSPNAIWNGQPLYGPGRFTGKVIYSKLGDREYPTVQLPK